MEEEVAVAGEHRLSCSSSASSCEVNQDDEYHDDGLPDLVLDASEVDESNADSSDNAAVVDLILSMTGGRRSLSVDDLTHHHGAISMVIGSLFHIFFFVFNV